jgi:hypothetical protein
MRRRLLAVPILLLVLAAAACHNAADDGIASANSTASPSTSPSAVSDEQALVDFAACMRARGQNLPDPDPNGGPFPPRGPHGAGWDAAEQACRQLLPDGGQSGGPDPQELEQLRAFAVCMRAHDIEMSDPELPGEGTHPGNMTVRGRLEKAGKTQLNNDPGFQTAMAACRDKLPNSGADKKAGK